MEYASDIMICKNCKHYENGICHDNHEETAETGNCGVWEERSKEDRSEIVYEDIIKKKQIKQDYLELTSGREKDWATASEILVNYLNDKMKIYTTKEDERNEVWVYQEGIYVPNGKSEIKKVLRELLGEFYSNYVYNLVLAKIEPDTSIDSKKFFNNNYVYEVPVQNGILNIITRELKPFNPEQIFFTKFPVKYDLSKKCAKIEVFLKEILPYNEDVEVFYEIAGFSLLKEYMFEKAIMMVGDGRNGKGKSLELLKRLIGVENCCSIPLTSLVPESFSVSELFGKMLNLAGDIGSHDLKETAMFKSVTGRDLIGGKRKFLRDIHFENYAKLIFACNNLPMVYDTSRGFWDRWILLQFPFTFVSKEEYDASDNKELLKIRKEDIIQQITDEEEMSGFLNEAIKGLHRLLSNKRFSSTKGTEEVKSSWIRQSNSFVAFCLDNIESDYDGRITKREMRKRYSDFCKRHKVRGKSDIVIKRTLQEEFGATEDFSDIFGNTREWTWTGIKWKTKETVKLVKDDKGFSTLYTGTSPVSMGLKTPHTLNIVVWDGKERRYNELSVEKDRRIEQKIGGMSKI